ncbi:uncharacterized protein [Aegilops tauschii subsp. strangulata]|uniref:uncharacterized protein n=1 Tax=Aegilops tauschii subsp. strangulata TaxID=200361 RepID=UPI003CC8C37C
MDNTGGQAQSYLITLTVTNELIAATAASGAFWDVAAYSCRKSGERDRYVQKRAEIDEAAIGAPPTSAICLWCRQRSGPYSLPDDLLLLVLARLRCVRTAARASVLSRRWRGLWTRLPALLFRDVAFRSVEPALAHAVSSASTDGVFLVDIQLPKREWALRASAPCVSVASLLRAAARLSPEKLVLCLPWGAAAMFEEVELPSFQRATSISLTSWSPINLRAPSAGESLPALTTLVLSGCTADGLAALVARCLRLRTLRFSRPGSSCNARIPLDITVRSSSLRELVIEETQAYVNRIDVATPMLEHLTVSALADFRLRVSVLAPMAASVTWRCRYYKDIWLQDDDDRTRSAYWTLDMVSLLSAPPAAAERRRPPVLRLDAVKNNFRASASWTQDVRQVEQHLWMEVAADLSVLDLELHLTTLGHVYGAVVFFLLKIHRIATAVHRLKLRVAKLDPETIPTEEEECGECCNCAPTNNWRSEVVTLTELTEVEIDGFEGDDHEFDVLKHLLKCAPMLKRMTLKQSHKVAPSDAKVHDFFKAHPFVECYYISSSDTTPMAC